MPRLLAHVPPVEARAALLAVASSVVLTAVKFAAYFLTGSTAVLSDALESIVNVFAAGFAAYAISLAHTPADDAHPYGHGKIEFLSAAFEGGMILLAGLVVAVKAASDILHGPSIETHRLGLGVALMVGTLLANGGLGAFLIRLGRRRQSLTLEADGHHLLSDAVTSTVALVGLALVWLMHWRYADPAAALAVSGYIAWIGWRLVGRASAGLMDKQDAADGVLLRNILDAHTGPAGKPPRICNYHKLRHRHSGRYHWVDFHMIVPADWTIDRGHEVATEIEEEIEAALGEGNATTHVEPCHAADCAACGGRMLASPVATSGPSND